MGTINVARHIAAPPEAVFAKLTDFEHAAENIGGIERLDILTDGPIGVGTRFRETRVMFKKEATEEMAITAFEPGRSYTVECESCGCQYRTVITCAPQDQGTTVSMDMTYAPKTLLAKLMSPIGKMMVGPMKKCIARDLDDIAASIEPRGPAQPS